MLMRSRLSAECCRPSIVGCLPAAHAALDAALMRCRPAVDGVDCRIGTLSRCSALVTVFWLHSISIAISAVFAPARYLSLASSSCDGVSDLGLGIAHCTAAYKAVAALNGVLLPT